MQGWKMQRPRGAKTLKRYKDNFIRTNDKLDASTWGLEVMLWLLPRKGAVSFSFILEKIKNYSNEIKWRMLYHFIIPRSHLTPLCLLHLPQVAKWMSKTARDKANIIRAISTGCPGIWTCGLIYLNINTTIFLFIVCTQDICCQEDTLRWNKLLLS